MQHYQNKICAPLTKPFGEESHGKFATNPPANPPFKKQNALNVYFHFGCAGGSTMKWDNLLFSTLQQTIFFVSLLWRADIWTKQAVQQCNTFRFPVSHKPSNISRHDLYEAEQFQSYRCIQITEVVLTFLSTFRSSTNPSFILMIKKLLYNVVSSGFSLTCLFGGCLLPNVSLTAHLRFFKIYSSRLIPLRYTASCKVNYDTSL